MGRIAFKGGTLIDGTGKEPIENSVILIEDNRIVKVGSEREVHIEKIIQLWIFLIRSLCQALPFRLCLGFPPWALLCGRREDLRKAVRTIARSNPDMIKIWATGGGLWTLERKTDQHYSFEEIQIVVEEANYLGLPVRAHAESLEGAKDCIEAGVYSIEHGQELDEECLYMMKDKDITFVPTMQFFYEWFTEYEPPYRSILDQYPGETIAEKN